MSPRRSHQPCTNLQKLQHANDYRLLLIIAPSGTNKTKFLQQWIQKTFVKAHMPLLWIELEIEDNHPIHFVNRLLCEFREWDAKIANHIDSSRIDVLSPPDNVSQESISGLGMAQNIESMFTRLINGLIQLDGDHFMIFDNYQIIREPEIHAIVANLIDYLPPNFHLIIASKNKPPLQIPRLRVRRELLEIDLKDEQRSQ